MALDKKNNSEWVTKTNTWAIEQIKAAQPFNFPAHEKSLSDLLVDRAYRSFNSDDNALGMYLGAAFDLLVAAEYYSGITNSGWSYCPEGEPLLIYPFLNICPRCVLNGNFKFFPGNKPKSGSIGMVTRRLLAVMLQSFFERSDKKLRILKGAEPVDLIIIDDAAKIVLASEIKAAPLIPLPVVAKSERMTEYKDGEKVDRSHGSTDNTKLIGSEFFILLPRNDSGAWKTTLVSLGTYSDEAMWAYNSIKRLVETTDMFSHYANMWRHAYGSYASYNQDPPLFWFTNACGQPRPRPDDWPERRNGEGHETISDGKTSVGMDRTDDIKKGIYQVLKLSTEGKPGRSEYSVKTALISNVDAVRHYREYLALMKNVVWTLDEDGKAKTVHDLPAGNPIFNLFDGIITFTKNITRDDWMRDNFAF